MFRKHNTVALFETERLSIPIVSQNIIIKCLLAFKIPTDSKNVLVIN